MDSPAGGSIASNCAVPCFDRHALWDARRRLAELDLLTYRPWRRDEPDGCYQLLSVQRLENRLSPELQEAMARAFAHLETPAVQP